MKLTLTGRRVEVTPGLRQLVTRRLARLERVVGDSLVSAQVVLDSERHRLQTEITMHMRGDHVLTGVGSATTWQLSVADAVAHVEQQAQKVKDRWRTRKRRATGGKRLPVASPPEPAAADGPRTYPRIYRSRTGVRALTIDDAAMRLGAGDDPFLLFRNSDTGRVALVYRRKDGHVALLEPES